MKESSPNLNNVFVNSVEKYFAIIKGLYQVLETWTIGHLAYFDPKKDILKAKIDPFSLLCTDFY
jgi:hypothetical protein